MRVAFRNWTAASEYLPRSKYCRPLRRYFSLRTLGSREHPDTEKATIASAQQSIRRENENLAIYLTVYAGPGLNQLALKYQVSIVRAVPLAGVALVIGSTRIRATILACLVN